jgi:transposase
MAHIQGEDRNQLALAPLCLDDYIEENSICRVIMAFVSKLDLASLGFKYALPNEMGRPSYNPSHLLMLYIYGYMNRVRSSRRLDAETRRNIEVMWLMEKLTPDDKTISNFRKDNAKAIKSVFRAFSVWCSENGLYGKELVAVDGTKIRANSSWKHIYTLDSAKKGLEKIDNKISRYMEELDSNDKSEADESAPLSEDVAEALSRLNKKKEKLNELVCELEKGEVKEISTIDPDARIMRQGGDGRARDACYNVRTVVDSKHKLIVDFENSTCANDIGTLSRSVGNAKDIMGIPKITAIADSGFYDGMDFERCEQNGITCYVAKLNRGSRAPTPEYALQHFKYNRIEDCYICPRGQKLEFSRFHRNKEKVMRVYTNPIACRTCKHHEDCTSNKRGYREINRVPSQDMADAVDNRMASNEGRQHMEERKKIVEHPYGTIKKVWGFGNFLCRGLEKTTSEASLAFLAYNIRRAYRIFNENGESFIKALT